MFFSLKYRSLLMVILLLLSVILVYERVSTFQFVKFDDTVQVTQNTHVRAGLSFENVAWAFSLDPSSESSIFYHPLTWLSHMSDIQLFGLNAGMHHLTNLSFHVLNTLLLFLFLWKVTNAYWKSLFAAAMFGLHPINVDTVAWISERKNLLSTCFWLLTMISYWYYAKKPVISRYLLCFFLFVCSLFSKNMVVTLPFVLLLLDYWPLNRILEGVGADDPAQSRILVFKRIVFLIFEKIPFFLSAFLGASLTLFIANKFPSPSDLIPLGLRISNAFMLYATYLVKLFLPLNLAVHHPYPSMIPWWQVLGAILFLGSFSLLVFFMRKKHRFLTVGWLWYLGTLVPVLGIMQSGSWPAYAERWAYVPLIGIFIIIAWGMPLILEKAGATSVIKTALPVIFLVFLGALAWIQTGYWKDSIILFSHAVDVTEKNDLVHNNLGGAYEELGLVDDAIAHYSEAVRINPKYVRAHSNLGYMYARKGNYHESMRHLTIATRLNPADARTYLNWGNAFFSFKENKKAILCYRHILTIDPEFAPAYYNLGNVYLQMHLLKEAVASYQKALQLQPRYLEAYCNLGAVLTRMGRYEEAIRQYTAALEIDPNLALAQRNREILSQGLKSKEQTNVDAVRIYP